MSSNISKILIANRGEIAVRIIRTCKEMGIKTVALFPTLAEKKQFLETELADEARCLGEEGIMGYLNHGKIIQIARNTGADAIHPGYGFLAESGDFADLCHRNNIKFIGPRGDILRMLGNKVEAKKVAKKVGLPLLPGTERAVKEEKDFLKIAKEIPLPFLLKAANGGGGMGIRIIDKENKEELIDTFRKLKREVINAFGSEEIFIEKFFENPRHIEFQILGDGKGKVLHFGERECSIQRRHQKLIEEAPSPFLDRKMRRKMGGLAVKLGEFLKYEGLGTVEFLVGQDKKFYFLEVNPRIQIKHPVTEIVSGFDLVEMQIKVAGGEELKLKQRDIKTSNWAMEFRIYAEDALNNFRSEEGTITDYLPPGGRGVEVHSFCRTGQKIFPYFDSLISKMVVFGKDREECLRKSKRALNEYLIEGPTTLIPFYKILLENKNFQKGCFSTSFIEKEKIIEILRKSRPCGGKIIEGNKKETEAEALAKMISQICFGLKSKESEALSASRWKMAERMSFEE